MPVHTRWFCLFSYLFWLVTKWDSENWLIVLSRVFKANVKCKRGLFKNTVWFDILPTFCRCYSHECVLSCQRQVQRYSVTFRAKSRCQKSGVYVTHIPAKNTACMLWKMTPTDIGMTYILHIQTCKTISPLMIIHPDVLFCEQFNEV